MSVYDIRWYDDEKTIILEQVTGKWKWEDIYAMMREQFALLDTIDHQAHIILIAPEGRIPIPAEALFNLHKIVETIHPNEGLKVLVGAPKPLELLFSVLSRVYQVREQVDEFVFTDSLDSALAMIERKKNGQIPA